MVEVVLGLFIQTKERKMDHYYCLQASACFGDDQLLLGSGFLFGAVGKAKLFVGHWTATWHVGVFSFVCVLQEGFCKFSCIASDVNQESSMKTALFAAAGVGIAGLTFLLVR